MNQKHTTKRLTNKQGMTLVEVLVAMAVLMIAIMTFLPLGQSSFQNIFTAGKRVKENYHAVGTIEKLIGNTGANGDYEAETLDLPMIFSNPKTAIKLVANHEDMQSINGVSILSTPEAPGRGFSTFICDSVTAQMMAFPKHISDDFIKKQITLYAVGFRFATDDHLKLKYTPQGNISKAPVDKDQLKVYVEGLPDVDKKYYSFEPDPDANSIAYLTLNGDNDQINFSTSPLFIMYRGYILQIEVDAPTVIMVGEAAGDGNYYYYVTSGEKINNEGKIDEKNGQIRLVRKKMNNPDPKPKNQLALAADGTSTSNITLSSAMNDIEWVGPGEGNDPSEPDNVNKYGYYNMCGDNGQVRRFWRKANGNYAWGGDYVRDYLYVYDDTKGTADSRTEMGNLTYKTQVQSSSVFRKKPDVDLNGNKDYAANKVYGDAGLRIMPQPADKDFPIFDRLFVQNAFTVSALTDPRTANNDLYFYAAGDALYTEGGGTADLNNKFMNVYGKNSWFTSSKNTLSQAEKDDLLFVKAPAGKELQGERNATQKIDARKVHSYEEYNKLDPNIKNHITLTSVDSVKMTSAVTSGNANYPSDSYTMYCGYIPAIMDLWATNDGVPAHTGAAPTEWRATLGVAFIDKDTKTDKYYKFYPKMMQVKALENYDGHLWHYGKADETNFALSGICGADNYNKENCPALYASLEAADKKGFNGNQRILPLNQAYNMQVLQEQEGNETMITMSYLSHPNALSLYNADGTKHINITTRDLTPSRQTLYSGAYEWAFDQSITIIDSDTICYPADDGTDRYFSIAVGYYVGGIGFEDQVNHEISVPSVMNNGIVFLRAGGKDGESLGAQGHKLEKESNVFNQFFTTGEYFSADQPSDPGKHKKNTLDQAVSARYWQDVYHPRFYSMSGKSYDPTLFGSKWAKNKSMKFDYKFNYLMGHILNDKRLNCVGWGETWEGRPEAMWGGSDGTLMSWFLEKEDANGNIPAKHMDAEFQSYNRLEYAKNLHDKYDKRPEFLGVYNKDVDRAGWVFQQQWVNTTIFGSHYSHLDPFDKANCVYEKSFGIPKTFSEAIAHIKRDKTDWENYGGTKTSNPIYHNAYLDKCSLQLATKGNNKIQDETMITKYGFISPLDSIEDLEYANDTWVAVGTQGASNPAPYCGSEAMVPATATGGSWVCVRSWLDQSGGTDGGPVDGNCNYIWQAVRVSNKDNVNVEQVTFSNGMWYAMGYYDANNNNEYDYDSGELAMLFYAEDPTQPNGTEKGWQLCDNGKGYTQAYCNANDAPAGAEEGTGDHKMAGFKLLDIDGINSVASRND